MSDILLNAIGNIRPVMHPAGLDLSEALGPEYVDKKGEPIVLPFRVNWTRGMKRQRHQLSAELYLQRTRALWAVKIEQINGKLSSGKSKKKADLQNERRDLKAKLKKEGGAPTDEESANNNTAWMTWWSEIFVMSLEDTNEFRESLPTPHWSVVVTRIPQMHEEWEAEEQKKANAPPEPTTETQNETQPPPPGKER